MPANSLTIGIRGIDERTHQRVNHILIPSNMPLPHTVQQTFKTAEPNQQSVQIEVLEGEHTQPDACTLVGVAVIRQLPPNLPEGCPGPPNFAPRQFFPNSLRAFRLSIETHRALRIRVAEDDTSIQKWVEALIERELEVIDKAAAPLRRSKSVKR